MLLPTPKRIFSLAAMCGGLFYFFQHFRVEGLDGLSIAMRNQPASSDALLPDHSESNSNFPSTSPRSAPSNWNLPSTNIANLNAAEPMLSSQAENLPLMQSANYASTGLADSKKSFRIAAINVNKLSLEKLNDPFVSDTLIRVLSEFACIALQEVSSDSRDLLPRIVQLLQQEGHRFDYLAAPACVVGTERECLAFLFDTDKLEIDRNQTYTLNDPHKVLHIEPLVGWFRTRVPDASQAYTFTLVNVDLRESATGCESDYLPELITSIERDGRNEDDLIIAGFMKLDAKAQNTAATALKILPQGQPAGMISQPVGRIILPVLSQDEFTGASGELNILRQYNLTPQQVLAVSPHTPVWAEFYANESVRMQ